MNPFIQTIVDVTKRLFQKKEQAVHEEVPVSEGSFYAHRFNTSACGKSYSKLVRRDRTGAPNPMQQIANGELKPQVGKRQRIKHRARTNYAASKAA